MSGDIKPDIFPHDRIVLFSDAVFAIAITLLVIEIKIPGHDAVEAHGLGGALAEMIPLFVGYLVSFLVITLFWVGHMKTWKHVTSATSGMVWLNIFELLFVALMPLPPACIPSISAAIWRFPCTARIWSESPSSRTGFAPW